MENEKRKIRCFWETLEDYDARTSKRSKNRAFLAFLRKLPPGAGFELMDYHDVWAVYKACRLSKKDGLGAVNVSVRKTNRGIFKLWVRKDEKRAEDVWTE